MQVELPHTSVYQMWVTYAGRELVLDERMLADYNVAPHAPIRFSQG
jgi:hypothetical protein